MNPSSEHDQHPARWCRIKEAVSAALDEGPTALDRHCEGNPEMRAEAEALLASILQASTAGFLENSALTIAAKWLEQDQRKEVPTQLGPWQILSELGHGGSARVFLAKRADGIFERNVAIKILPFGLFGQVTLDRFLQERQILGNLDHPYIVRPIDGGVTHDGRPYLVMDWVDGRSLTQHVQQFKLSQEARLELFYKVCSAVEYSHRKGVVHRDLKPNNIFVAADHTPRLLDFGMAKLTEGSVEKGLTVLGGAGLTWAYASPEQAQGKSGGPASDIYSLGMILCELLTGQLPYSVDGMSTFDSARVISESRPNLHGVPHTMIPVIEQCLAKNPEKRYRTPDAFVAALLDARTRISPGYIARRALLFSGVVGAAGMLVRNGDAPHASRLVSPPGKTDEVSAVFSPEGREIAVSRGDGLWVRNLETGEERHIWKNGKAFGTKWSPDGRFIALIEPIGPDRHALLLMEPNGRNSQVIRQLRGACVDWMPDSRSLAVVDSSHVGDPLSGFILQLNTNSLRRVTFPKPGSWGDVALAVSHDGKHLAVARYSERGRGDIYMEALDGGEARRLSRMDSWINGLTFTQDDSAVVFSATWKGKEGLWQARRNGKDGEVTFLPGQLGGEQFPVFGHDGSDLLYSRHVWQTQVMLAKRGRTGTSVLAFPGGGESPAVSPNGGTIAAAAGSGTSDEIWSMDVDAQRPRRIAHGDFVSCRNLSWSPDGAYIAFSAVAEGKRFVFTVPANATGPARRLTNSPYNESKPSWSADGKAVYLITDRSGVNSLVKVTPQGGELTTVLDYAVAGIESRDGKHIYITNDEQASELFVLPVSGGVPARVPNVPRVEIGRWGTLDGGGLYFVDNKAGGITLQQTMSEPGTAFPKKILFIPGRFADGTTFSYHSESGLLCWSEPRTEAQLYMMRNFRY